MTHDLLVFGDPSGIISLRSIERGYSPEQIVVWENDPRHVYAIQQISDKINIINCEGTEFANELSTLNMDFTTTLGNPPYMKNLHLEFLKIALLRSKKIRLTQPSGWLFRTEKKIEREVKELLDGRLKKLTFYNGNSVFTGAEFDCPLVIIEAEESHEGPIEVCYRNTGNTYYVNSIYDMPTGFWEPSEQMLSLVSKFTELTQSSCIYDLVGKYKGKSFVSSPRTCGHAKSNKPEEFCTKDFFTFFYKRSDILTLDTKNPCYNVDTDAERDSLISYMKTKVARFGFAIHKISRDCYVSRYLSKVPLPPLDRQWTDESIMDYYNFSDSERQFIDSFIPNYYGQ